MKGGSIVAAIGAHQVDEGLLYKNCFVICFIPKYSIMVVKNKTSAGLLAHLSHLQLQASKGERMHRVCAGSNEREGWVQTLSFVAGTGWWGRTD